MSNSQPIVGSKIKGIRESKNLSVEEIAERSGLSVEQILSVENDHTLPSLGPLIKIARALGVRLGTFLDDSDELGPVVCRAADRDGTTKRRFRPKRTGALFHEAESARRRGLSGRATCATRARRAATRWNLPTSAVVLPLQEERTEERDEDGARNPAHVTARP